MQADRLFQFDSSYDKLPEVFYEHTAPVPVAAPRMVVFNQSLANALGMEIAGIDPDELAAIFAGNRLPKDARPLAQAYAGHQFGHFTMLGDGRAHLLGEHLTPDGQRVDIQLKGSGPTPFSRRGDGRAVLGPMLREYLISEAMAALGIPTTRSLAVVATGEPVQRETPLPGAILTRVAASHLRVGTFEFAAAHRDPTLLQALLDYTIHRHFSQLADADNKALALLDAITESQANLITHWMRVGFIHGVMNTDNMALSGETIDFGPCAFMDTYDPATCFSSIDTQGRYAYANQPAIAMWNLSRFAESLLPAIHHDDAKAVELAQASLNRFADRYRDNWLNMMRDKLGLFGQDDADLQLITDLLTWMKQQSADYTNTFRDLSRTDQPTAPPYDDHAFAAWHARWQGRLKQNNKPLKDALQRMQRTNPAVIPRNHQVEQALAAATIGNMKPFLDLHAALQSPYDDRPELTPYQTPPGPEACRYQTFCGT